MEAALLFTSDRDITDKVSCFAGPMDYRMVESVTDVLFKGFFSFMLFRCIYHYELAKSMKKSNSIRCVDAKPVMIVPVLVAAISSIICTVIDVSIEIYIKLSSEKTSSAILIAKYTLKMLTSWFIISLILFVWMYIVWKQNQ